MLFTPVPLSEHKLSNEELRQDCDVRLKFGPCAVGEKALYLNVYLLDRFYYIPLDRVERVYKRLAVSKGFFESGKVFITLSYLVVLYDGGQKKVCRFTHEEDVDAMLEHIRHSTDIPVGKFKGNTA